MEVQLSYDSKYWFLRNHNLFSALNNDETKTICLISNFKTVARGEIINFPDTGTQRVYALKRGIIKIVGTDENGNEIIKDILQAGDLFGQLAFGTDDQDDYAVALSDRVVVCSFFIEDFEKVIERNPALAIKYTKLVGLRFKRLENRYVNLINKDVKTRLKIFLKDWASKELPGQEQQITFKNYLTHQDIANVICSTRQTVTQLFNEFKTNGLLDYSRNEITIFDVSKLS
jgi:CRP/FNR family transcriptional regulator, cyclic AMP receptor protein